MKKNIRILTLLLVFLFLLTGQSLAAGLEKIKFLKISPENHKAVLKTPEGELQLVGVGDVVGDATIVEIVEGRIVLERPSEGGKEMVIVRFDEGRQRIESIQARGEKPPVMTAPGKTGTDVEKGSPGYQ
jgi:hypothetical protein